MIKLFQMNGEMVVVNAELISYIKAQPNTVLTLTNGDKIVVKETVDEVIDKIIEYRKKINKPIIEKE
ncbi:MAG: flagellar FlbD family protein [Candidatus Omnitrophica bacterium]|nr:flagellar FlbD family protein [Candidatus Omnitrophota bacterium]MCM8826391.1 flagellar FlbD family protein [Candidatus Omnitrophota bacterium]